MQKTFLIIALFFFSHQLTAMDTDNLEEAIRSELPVMAHLKDEPLACTFNYVSFINEKNVYQTLSLLIIQQALPNLAKEIDELLSTIPGEQKTVLKSNITTIADALRKKTNSKDLAIFLTKSRKSKKIQEIAYGEFETIYIKSIRPTLFKFLREQNKQS